MFDVTTTEKQAAREADRIALETLSYAQLNEWDERLNFPFVQHKVEIAKRSELVVASRSFCAAAKKSLSELTVQLRDWKHSAPARFADAESEKAAKEVVTDQRRTTERVLKALLVVIKFAEEKGAGKAGRLPTGR